VRTKTLDLASPAAVRRALHEAQARVVVNAAAWTNVDAAERAPLQARAANAVLVETLAKACAALNALLVQISTDYVFGADAARRTPYSEDVMPAPVNVYGQTKLEGERLAAAAPRHLIVRTSGLYGGGTGTKPGFVETILRLARELPQLRVVADQWCSPSYAPHVALAIVRLVEAGAQGTYHAVNSGEVSWLNLAREALRLAGINAKLVPISLAEYGHAAPRPRYTALDATRYAQLVGASLPAWHEALAECLRTPGLNAGLAPAATRRDGA
jgi:dTDP-4-dehydrorhamnose reductase